eukprot:PITA_03230
MVVQEKKKKGRIRICVDLRKLNDACVHDPFLTPFTDEVLENVGEQESYSFTDGFSGYHHIKIALEDRSKTTFTTKWGCFQYTVMPFGLKNVPTIFSCVVVVAFKEYIHKFLEVYLDGWIVFRTHFLNETISTLTEEFQVYHQQGTSYHLQANGTIEAFNNILETALKKTPFWLIYGTEAVMPMEYIVPSLWVAVMTGMSDCEALEEMLVQLEELVEEQFLVGFHQ